VRRILPLLRAAGSYTAALVTRRDAVVGRSEAGYPVLESWDRSPEQEVAARCRAEKQAVPPAARAALYCYDGAHRGEVLLLRREVESVGVAVGCTLVVTPRTAAPEAVFQFSFGRTVRLVAGPGATFQLNDKVGRDCELYDYDRLDFLDNRFLFLDLAGVTA
jgi:hypothetical protein